MMRGLFLDGRRSVCWTLQGDDWPSVGSSFLEFIDTGFRRSAIPSAFLFPGPRFARKVRIPRIFTRDLEGTS
jgi:hypothetical protein